MIQLHGRRIRKVVTRRCKQCIMGMPILSNGLCTWQDESFEVHTSIDSCWKVILVFVSYFWACCDISEGLYISSVRHKIMVSRPTIWCLVSHTEVGSVEDASGQDMKGTLRGGKNTGIYV